MTDKKLVYKIDWKKVTTDRIISILQAYDLAFPPNTPLGALADLIYPVDSQTGTPYTPLFKENDQFVYENQVIGIVKKDDKIGYIREDGIMHYYVLSTVRPELGTVDMTEAELQQLSPYVKDMTSTTEPPKPGTLNEAIDYVWPQFAGLERDARFETWPEDTFTAFCASSGTEISIRNLLNLDNPNNPLTMHFKSVLNIQEPREMIGAILKEIFNRLRRNIPPTTQAGFSE